SQAPAGVAPARKAPGIHHECGLSGECTNLFSDYEPIWPNDTWRRGAWAAGNPSQIQQVGRDERKDDRGVGLDDVARARHVELPPGDLLVRDRAAIGTVRRRRIRDLTEVRPFPDRRFEILLDERHDADGEVARDAAANLEEP